MPEQAAWNAHQTAEPGADRQDHQGADHDAGRLVDVVLRLVIGSRGTGEHQEVQARHVEGRPERRHQQHRPDQGTDPAEPDFLVDVGREGARHDGVLGEEA